MLLKDLLKNIDFELLNGSLDIQISDIIYDSRRVVKNCAFVCLKGLSADGHKFAASAAKNGAAALIVMDDTVNAPDNITVVKVADTRASLAVLSVNYFKNPAAELTAIAITGTKGKTTTAAMIKAILEKEGIKTATIGTLGIIIGDNVYKTKNTTPESYEVQQSMRRMLDEGCKAVVIEASSIGLKTHRVDGINFDIGVFTNFSHDHIGKGEHESMEEYLYCKSLLFKRCKTGIINIDDSAVPELLKDSTCRTVTFAIDNKADYMASDERLLSNSGFIGVEFKVSGKKSFTAQTPIPGRFSIYNALAAVAVCDTLNISERAVKEGLAAASVKGRLEPVPVSGDFTVLIDYAHNALSMESVLTTLREYNPNRIITMFGAGGNRPKVRRYEMGEVSGRLSDISVVTEDNSRFEEVGDIIADIIVGLQKTDGKYVVVENRAEAIKYCLSIAQKGDIVLLAGKGHEDYQEIKGVRRHFDEREVIAEYMDEKDKNNIAQ